MTKRQENRLRMFQSVKGVLDSNTDIISRYPKFTETSNEFSTNLSKILKFSVEAAADTTGVTGAKAEAKNEMAIIAAELASALKAYAFDKRDTMLETAIDFSLSEILQTTDAETMQTAGLICEEANKNLQGLGGYMVTPEDVEELQTAITRFEKLSEHKGEIKSSSVSNTRRLAQLMRKTNNMVKMRMDQLVTRLKRKHPVFFDVYMNARNILDY